MNLVEQQVPNLNIKTMNNFIENDTIIKIISQIPKGKRYSDVEDAEGNQYVDLVQEGGGVLGIALVGYTMYLKMQAFVFLASLAPQLGQLIPL